MKHVLILAIVLTATVGLSACSASKNAANTATGNAAGSNGSAAATNGGTPAANAASAASSPGAASATTADACALVSQDEASSFLGSKALPALKAVDRDGFRSCRYDNAAKTQNVFVQYVDPKVADVLAKIGGKPVPGVGDGAVWNSGSIFIQKNGKAVQVGLFLNMASMKTMSPREPELAKRVAARI